MRRRSPFENMTEPPPLPDFGSRPRCRSAGPLVLGLAHPGNRVRPCGECDAVAKYNDRINDYRADLSEWRDQIDDRTPLEIIEAVTAKRGAIPDSPLCLADL